MDETIEQKKTLVSGDLFKGIVIGVILIAALFMAYSYYNDDIQKPIAAAKDLNISLQKCNTAYINDVNLLLNTGNTMYSHLVSCYTTAQCLNDWNACTDKANIATFGKACLVPDQNIIATYNIFRRN